MDACVIQIVGLPLRPIILYYLLLPRGLSGRGLSGSAAAQGNRPIRTRGGAGPSPAWQPGRCAVRRPTGCAPQNPFPGEASPRTALPLREGRHFTKPSLADPIDGPNHYRNDSGPCAMTRRIAAARADRRTVFFLSSPCSSYLRLCPPNLILRDGVLDRGCARSA